MMQFSVATHNMFLHIYITVLIRPFLYQQHFAELPYCASLLLLLDFPMHTQLHKSLSLCILLELSSLIGGRRLGKCLLTCFVNLYQEGLHNTKKQFKDFDIFSWECEGPIHQVTQCHCEFWSCCPLETSQFLSCSRNKNVLSCPVRT